MSDDASFSAKLAEYRRTAALFTGAVKLGGPPVELTTDEKAQLSASVLPPLYIIHTVHGTWARDATWPNADSPLLRAIRKALGWRAVVVPMGWTGANQVGDRQDATVKLRQQIQNMAEKHPAARHFIVGHSHGGNIALMAADKPEIAERLAGVVTLSTPFLTARVRDLAMPLDETTAFMAAMAGATGFASWSLYRHAAWAWITPRALGVFAATWILLLIGGACLRQMQRLAVRLNDAMPRTVLRREQLAIIRVQGDEPTAIIAGVRLAGTVAELIGQTVNSHLDPAVTRLLSASQYAKLPGALSRVIDAIAPKQTPAWRPGMVMGVPAPPSPLVQFATTYWPLALLWGMDKVAHANPVVHVLLLALALLYGLPAIFALAAVVVGIPGALMSGISLVMAGLKLPLAGPFLDLAAEASPPGEWSVTNLECERIHRGLLHSEIHVDAHYARTVATWIASRVTVSADSSSPA